MIIIGQSNVGIDKENIAYRTQQLRNIGPDNHRYYSIRIRYHRCKVQLHITNVISFICTY